MGSNNEELDLQSKEICPAYCVEFCVYSLLPQLGHCSRKHIERARMLYEERGPLPEYENYFLHQLEIVIGRLKENLANNEEKLAATIEPNSERELIEAYQKKKKLEDQILLVEHEIYLFGTSGLMSEALRDLSLLSELTTKKHHLIRKIKHLHDKLDFSSPQKLQSCLICGALLGAADTDEHLAQHFKGRTHQAYATVRRAWIARCGYKKLPELPILT